MPYALGIDLGSGHLTAALSRNDHERWSAPETVALDGSPAAEAVLHLTDEGTVEVGSRALRHVPARSDRVARGFVERVGDEVPIMLGGRPYPAEGLIAALVGWIVDHAEAVEGGPASHLVVAHPADWGTHRRATLLGALREVGLPELTLLPRPVAAAESYAAGERVEVGQEIAVHSLGAGRFESAVLRRGSFGFELCAHADSAEPLGGDLFDDLLAEHVLAELDMEVDPAGLAKLRVACRSAKERLSTELAVTVPAPARSKRGTVMVNRTDLEELVRPAVEATVTSLRRTIQAAGTSTGSLRAVVLVGGCGRIPLVSELVSAGVRVRVAAAADPQMSVARGAALAAARVAKPTVQAPALAHRPIARSAVTHTDLMRFDDLPDEEVADIGPPPPRPPVEIAPLEPPRRRLLRLGTRTAGGTRLDDDLDLDEPPARGRPRDLDLRPRRRSPDLDPKPRHDPDDDVLDLAPDSDDDDARPGAYDSRPRTRDTAPGDRGSRRVHDSAPPRRRDAGFPDPLPADLGPDPFPDAAADPALRRTSNPDGDPAPHTTHDSEPDGDHAPRGTYDADPDSHSAPHRTRGPEPDRDTAPRGTYDADPNGHPTPRRTYDPDPDSYPAPHRTRGPEPDRDTAPRRTYDAEPDGYPAPHRTRNSEPDGGSAPRRSHNAEPHGDPAARRVYNPDQDGRPAPSRAYNPEPDDDPAPRRTYDAGPEFHDAGEHSHRWPNADHGSGPFTEPVDRYADHVDPDQHLGARPHHSPNAEHGSGPRRAHHPQAPLGPERYAASDADPAPHHPYDPEEAPRRRTANTDHGSVPLRESAANVVDPGLNLGAPHHTPSTDRGSGPRRTRHPLDPEPGADPRRTNTFPDSGTASHHHVDTDHRHARHPDAYDPELHEDAARRRTPSVERGSGPRQALGPEHHDADLASRPPRNAHHTRSDPRTHDEPDPTIHRAYETQSDRDALPRRRGTRAETGHRSHRLHEPETEHDIRPAHEAHDDPLPRSDTDPGTRRRRYLDDDREPGPRTETPEQRPARRRADHRELGRRLRADAELVHHDPDAGGVPEPRHREAGHDPKTRRRGADRIRTGHGADRDPPLDHRDSDHDPQPDARTQTGHRYDHRDGDHDPSHRSSDRRALSGHRGDRESRLDGRGSDPQPDHHNGGHRTQTGHHTQPGHRGDQRDPGHQAGDQESGRRGADRDSQTRRGTDRDRKHRYLQPRHQAEDDAPRHRYADEVEPSRHHLRDDDRPARHHVEPDPAAGESRHALTDEPGRGRDTR
jgi:actin-like ATPase involved in cell morphogenesis